MATGIFEQIGKQAGEAMARRAHLELIHTRHFINHSFVEHCPYCKADRLERQLEIIEQPHFHLCCVSLQSS